MEDQKLAALSDEELLRRIAAVVGHSRRTEAEIVSHLAELDARRLYARQAFPSLHAYCTVELHFSDAEAYLRISAARASREHPILLAMLSDGRLHLSAIERLAPHLTAENRDALLARAAHKSKRQVEELLAELLPKPDAPALIRKLPERRAAREVSSVLGAAGGATIAPTHVDALRSDQANPPSRTQTIRPGPVPTSTAGFDSLQEVPDPPTDFPTGSAIAAGPDPGSADTSQPATKDVLFELRPNGAAASGPRPFTVARRELIAPTSPGRYKVQFTASAELRDKLERLRELMGVSGADLALVIEQAVSEKLERLEARRFGLVRRGRPTSVGAAAKASPRPALPPASVGADAGTGSTAEGKRGTIEQLTCDTASMPREVERRPAASGSSVRRVTRHIPAAVRRAVYLRDGGRCTYTDATGRRCGSRRGIEIHHDHPYGYGGDHDLRNLRLRCWCHHRLATEADYGARPESRRARDSVTLR